MDTIIGKQVTHKKYGEGTIVEVDDNSIVVDFGTTKKKFSLDMFLGFFKVDDEVSKVITEKIAANKRAKAAEQAREDAAREAERRKKEEEEFNAKFGADYNVRHLKRSPVLSSSDVEKEFGIKRYGFGRGINVTDDAIILISSLIRDGMRYTYHDHFDVNGDFIYSGEGQNGDQTMTHGNSAIVEAAQNNKKIILIIKASPAEYMPQGEYCLVEYTVEDDTGEDGEQRKEYKFRLRKMNASTSLNSAKCP